MSKFGLVVTVEPAIEKSLGWRHDCRCTCTLDFILYRVLLYGL